MLARYADPHGRLREVLTRPGSAGSVLVIDRDAITRGDRRLVAHLAADEPPGNADLACRDYLSLSRPEGRICRALSPEDLWIVPFADEHRYDLRATAEDAQFDESRLVDRAGHSFRLFAYDGPERTAIPELRWHRLLSGNCPGAPQPLSVRAVIAVLESYQPVRALTIRALARHRDDPCLSICTLQSELERLDASPIVLNRGLREAVLQVISSSGVSMNEIAIRCGRFKRDSRGMTYGDTSWLARRVGLLAAAGRGEPTPWVHSDVLALIARRGLAISPREVELG